MLVPFARLSGGGLLYIVGNARLPADEADAAPDIPFDEPSSAPLDEAPLDAESEVPEYVAFSAEDANIPRAAAFSSGESFYVPWDMSYLNQFQTYIIGGLGVVGLVCALVFILPFGMNLIFGFIHGIKK